MKANKSSTQIICLAMMLFVLGCEDTHKSYSDQAIKAKITEGILITNLLKTGISGTYTALRQMPPDQTTAGMGSASSYSTDTVQSISYSKISDDTATLTIAYKAIGDIKQGDTIVFTAKGTDRGITWSCGTGSILDKYKPANCR